MHQIQSKLADLKELIEHKAFHPYLARIIDGPTIDEDKLLLLLSVFDQLDLSEIEKNTYITATIFIQLALDTHDKVQTNSIDEELKSQQLTVLAGDYYSGLYYKTLSGINDINLILELSKGVKEINENKIMVYEQYHTEDVGKVLASLKIIEGSLIEKITNHFKASHWTEFALSFLLVKRLLLEKSQVILTGSSVGYEAIKKALFPNVYKEEKELSREQQKQLSSYFDEAINQAIIAMDIERQKQPYLNELLSNRIQEIKNKHQSMAKTFAEEG